MNDSAAPCSSLRPLAHELRNAIAPVRNAAHLLRKRGAGDPVVAAAVQTIDAALTQSLKLLDRAVDAERVMRGDVQIASADVDVDAIVRQAIDDERKALDERGQRVRVHVRDAGLRVRGDAARLAQVVATLIDNASRYSDDGADIDVTIDASDGAARVRVKDSGAGIASDFLPRVFEPFAAPDREAGHAGSVAMSLPVARRLVELHGGRIDAASEGEGRGSEFSVELPRVRPLGAPASATGSADAPARSRAARLRVLLVDDNRAVRETYADVLADLGCDVDTAADGEEAIARAMAWRPRFVVLDINLPKRNGYDVARVLRERFPSSEMTLVMISGTMLDAATIESARSAGFDHCIDKASDIAVLERLLGAS